MMTFWPNGLMDNATLSNQYSTFKRKREKDGLKDGQSPIQSCGYTVRVDPFSPIVPRKGKDDDSKTGEKRKTTLSHVQDIKKQKT